MPRRATWTLLAAARRCLPLPLLPSPPAAAATFLARPACYCLP
jgi:hypothetical protein